MTGRFVLMPFAPSVQSSEFAGAPEPADAQVLWDPPEDLEPDAPGDAAHSDDEGPAWPPTRAAFLRSRVDQARRLLVEEAATASAGSAAPQTAHWQFIIKQFAPGLREMGSKALALPSEARLERDARGNANKPKLDRGSEGPVIPDAGLAGARLGERDARGGATNPWLDRQAAQARPQKPDSLPQLGRGPKAFAQRLRRAAILGERDRVCDCKERFERCTKQELLREIAWTGASDLPPGMLRDSYTKVGLIAILCAAGCRARESTGGASSSRSAGRGARNVPPRRGPPPARKPD